MNDFEEITSTLTKITAFKNKYLPNLNKAANSRDSKMVFFYADVYCAILSKAFVGMKKIQQSNQDYYNKNFIFINNEKIGLLMTLNGYLEYMNNEINPNKTSIKIIEKQILGLTKLGELDPILQSIDLNIDPPEPINATQIPESSSTKNVRYVSYGLFGLGAVTAVGGGLMANSAKKAMDKIGEEAAKEGFETMAQKVIVESTKSLGKDALKALADEAKAKGFKQLAEEITKGTFQEAVVQGAGKTAAEVIKGTAEESLKYVGKKWVAVSGVGLGTSAFGLKEIVSSEQNETDKNGHHKSPK